MIIAEGHDPLERRVDLSLLRDEGRQRLLVRFGDWLVGPGGHLWLRASWSNPINASSVVLIQGKIDPIVLFFSLTSSASYGWRES
jgi:hypothetical protein